MSKAKSKKTRRPRVYVPCNDAHGSGENAYICVLPHGHRGNHSTEGGFTTWPRELAPADRKLAIAVAVDALKACRVPEGGADAAHTWAYFANETRTWWAVTSDSMIRLANAIDSYATRALAAGTPSPALKEIIDEWAEADSTGIELDRVIARELERSNEDE